MSDHIRPNDNENHKLFRKEFFYKKVPGLPDDKKDGFDLLKIQVTCAPTPKEHTYPGCGIERFYFSHN